MLWTLIINYISIYIYENAVIIHSNIQYININILTETNLMTFVYINTRIGAGTRYQSNIVIFNSTYNQEKFLR